MKYAKKAIVLIVCGLVLLVSPSFIQAGKVKLRVTVEKANVRLKPDLGSMVISEVPLGAVLEAEEQIGEWFKVNLPPDEKGFVVTGYIHSSAVELVEEKPVEEKPVSPPPPPPPPPSAEPPQPPAYQPTSGAGISFSLRFLGGMNYLSGGDINEGIKGWNDMWHDQADFMGFTMEGEMKPIHLGFDFGGDIIVNLTPQIGVGLGIGYLQGSKTSEVTFANGTTGTMTNKPKIRAVPITMGVFYTLPMNGMMRMVLNAGAGLYIAKYSHNWRLEENGYWQEFTQEASATGFGFHGGLGFEFDLSPNIAFVLEGQGRYAKFGGFEGKYDFEFDYSPWLKYSEKEEGKLYYYKYDAPALGKYTYVFVCDEKPSGVNYSDVREAKVDFSGFTFLAGIRVRF